MGNQYHWGGGNNTKYIIIVMESMMPKGEGGGGGGKLGLGVGNSIAPPSLHVPLTTVWWYINLGIAITHNNT